MQRINPDVDIVMQVLAATLKARPNDSFVLSLQQQYVERGGLSKKQLQGLYAKASKLEDIPAGKLATLEAIILRKHTRNRSDLPPNKPLYEKDPVIGNMLQAILAKYPQHRSVLFLQSKYDNNEVLAPAEITELERLHKLLLKK